MLLKETGFNPTLVRLRRALVASLAAGGEGFNPTLVRLRLRLWCGLRCPIGFVSIPRWFD